MNKNCWIQSPVNLDGAAMEFRKEFAVEKKVVSATVKATAMGVYALYLNGARLLENGVLTPGFTGYKNQIQYQTYDVTKSLRKKNKIVLAGAPGWAVGHIGYQDGKNYFADHISVIAEISIRYEDGTKETFYTDKTWDVYTSPVEYSDIYMGETLNLCHRAKFLGKALSSQVSTKLIPQVGEIIAEQDRVSPARLIVTPKGERVIDFAQNMTGYVEFKVSGKRGERIRLSFGEVLDKDGNFYNANYRKSKNDVIYVLDGKERTVKPTFTFQGFRYIRLDEFPEGEVDLEKITAIAVHSDIKRTGYFKCGNDKINQLYSNAVWGQKSNYLDIPTDCPQRDERLGWTGDTQVFCRTAAINYNVKRFFDKWLMDVRSEQKPSGAVLGVVPTPYVVGDYDTRTSAAWGDCATIVPWELYMAYGDKKILADNFDLMRRWVEYMHGVGDEEFLWLGGNHYGDWLAMDAGGDYYHGATSYDLIATAFFARSTEILIKSGKILGKDMSEYEALYKNILKRFREYFTDNGVPKAEVPMTYRKRNWDYGTILPISARTQTALVLMLHFHLCPEEERPMLTEMLCDLIEKNDGLMATGFVGTPYLLHALSENGKCETAYKLLLQEKNPSWLFSVNHGATTIWEHWNSVKEDGTFWSTDMNSFNHYAYGSVFDWVFGVACGIKPIEAGYRSVRLAPVPSRALGGFAQYAIDTVQGRIVSKWFYHEDTVRFEFDIPSHVEAEIELPDGTCRKVVGGKHVFTIKA